jgi:hypothetical protein
MLALLLTVDTSIGVLALIGFVTLMLAVIAALVLAQVLSEHATNLNAHRRHHHEH